MLHRVQGLSLPLGQSITNQSFIDDTTLYLTGTKENLVAAMDIVEVYCQASCSKINWHKSIAI